MTPSPDKPMTDRERAENIVNEYFNGDNGKNTSLYEKIIHHLEQARAEGFKEAQEKVAEIVGTCWQSEVKDCECPPHVFAQRIRAMSPQD